MNFEQYEKVFNLFKCIAVGEIVSIAMVLLANMYLYPELLSIAPLTIFPYLSVRAFDSGIIFVWIVLGTGFCYGCGDASKMAE